MLSLRISLIYKVKYTFVTMNLVARIKKVIDESELSSAAFADKIGVQRSSISHILSGRNKPSLDFILKVLHAFPTVQSDWLLLGISKSNPTTNTEIDLFSESKQESNVSTTIETQPAPSPLSSIDENTAATDKEVKQITIFYNDGTCSTYTNKK